MTTNIDRAAEVLWLPEPHLFGSECDDQARELAKALAEAGLLAPDLPEADRDGRLWPEHGFTYSHVQSTKFTGTGNIIIARGASSLVLTREEAIELASLLTAAVYAERNQE